MSQQKAKITIIGGFFVPFVFTGEEIVLNLAQAICGRFLLGVAGQCLLFLLSNCLLFIQVRLTKAILKPGKYYLI